MTIEKDKQEDPKELDEDLDTPASPTEDSAKEDLSSEAAEPTAGEGMSEASLSESGGTEIQLPEETLNEALSAASPKTEGIFGALLRFFSRRAVRITATALLAPVLVSAGVLIGLHLQNASTDPDLDPGAEEYPYVGSVTPQEGEISIPGYADMVFPANTQKVRVALVNPKENDCYFVFSFLLWKNGEELYRSGMIPPGMAVTEQTLSRGLSAGEYLLILRVQSYSLSDKKAMNSVDMEVILTVQ